MLPATSEETQTVIEYMNWQAPDLTVEFVQKIYAENVLDHQHVVWDVHTNVDRWWVITNPTNLYSQAQFPNMDLAVTFHVGLCLRVPRSEKQNFAAMPIEPFAECFRLLSEATDAFYHAQEVADYQAIGVRCREALLAYTNAVQIALPWTSSEAIPKKASFKEWIAHMGVVTMGGSSSEVRRHFIKTLLYESWDFANWLTHAKASRWFDADAALSITEHSIGLASSLVIRYLRGVPEVCPVCGSNQLSRQRSFDPDSIENEWERPTCAKCDWTGEPVQIFKMAGDYVQASKKSGAPDGECIFPTVPLRTLVKPTRKTD